MTKRTVFLLSDSTGISAETLGNSLITQFPHIEFDAITLPFINSEEKARITVEHINQVYQETGLRPLLFSTFVKTNLRDIIMTSHGMMLDVFATFIHPLEQELGTKASHASGVSHKINDYQSYKTRIDAINYTLNSDDGVNTRDYAQADLIVVGPSRSGKTPTCLYLALQFGMFAANYPFTEEDNFEHLKLPACLTPYKHKIFGLTIDPQRLHLIRSERRANSPYAAQSQCEKEVQACEHLYLRESILHLNTTTHSIEELATKMLDMLHITRKMH